MKHLTDEVITRYITETASDEELFYVDSHLTECSYCLERIQAIIYLKNNFDEIWNSWSAEEVGKAAQRLKQSTAFFSIIKKHRLDMSKLSKWLEKLDNGAVFSLNMLVDSAKNTAMASANILKGAFDIRLRPAFSGIGSPEAAELEDKLIESSIMLSCGNIEEARRLVEEVGRKDSRAAQARTLEIYHDGEMQGRAVIDGRKRQAVIVCNAVDTNKMLYAILVPDTGQMEPVISEFKSVDGADYLIAEFKNLPDGIYTISIITG